MNSKNFLSSVYFLILFVFSLTITATAFAQRPSGSGRPAKAISYGSGRSGVLFDVAVYYGQSQGTADPSVGNEWKSTASIYDIKLGYITNDSFYFGGEYSTYNQSNTATLSTSAMDQTAGGGAGAGIGYFWTNGFHARAYYRFNESFGDYKDGTGFQADLGFQVNMTSNFYLGLLMSHRQVTFKKNQYITNFDHWTKKETYPFITLGFLIN